MKHPSQTERLLLDILKKDAPVQHERLRALSAEAWTEMLDIARDQRVTPLAWHRIKQKQLEGGIPAAAASSFEKAFRSNALRNLDLAAQARLLAAEMAFRGIPVVFLKGIVLACAVYEMPALREMNDLDLLVRPEHLHPAASMLESMGFQPATAIAGKTEDGPEGHHLPGFLKSGCAKVEVHWNLANPDKPYSIHPEALWTRTVPFSVAGARALSLSNEDLLLHLCLHASYLHQFYFGLRPSCDIASVLERHGSSLDWEAVIERANQWAWQRGVYLALYFAKDLLDASVPEDVLSRMRPADLPENIIESALGQIFTDRKLARMVTQPFAEFVTNSSPWDKAKILWRRIFLPRKDLARKYSLPADSMKVYLFYPRRLLDVLERHKTNFGKILKDDPHMKGFVNRRQTLVNWMENNR